METNKAKKTDRRTQYTKSVIKDAFLTLKAAKAYNDITITDICRQAEINRGTFYLHYANIRQVLDEVLDDALKNVHGLLEQVLPGRENDCTFPLCRFLRANPKYQVVFFDETLYTHVVDRAATHAKDDFVARMRERSDLFPEAIEALFYFQISGCLAISKRNASSDDEQWDAIQCAVDTLMRSGIEKL